MKLIDALRAIEDHDRLGGQTLRVALVCGFMPLHLQTFLHAHLVQLFPENHIEITTGLFGDIAGTLKALKKEKVGAVALLLEWEDLDARLGIRQLGGWGPNKLENIVEQVRMRLAQLQLLLMDLARSAPVIVGLPTLPLPPLFLTTGWQSANGELSLKKELHSFAAGLGRNQRIRFVSETRLAVLSPQAQRLNVRSHWIAGFPYQLSHASALAAVVARLIQNPLPLKGLITDLDDTLWSGIVGDVGTQGIHWDLDHHSHGHGLYQQLLRSFSEEGVLIGVASKNDPEVVEEAFQREDLLLPKSSVFPLEVSWASKANAISRILQAWNVGPESIVFIDDNPLELAEVGAAHPLVSCFQFPRNDPQAIYDLLVRLRDLFGKSGISEEDALRLESIRSSATLRESGEDSVEGFSEALLEQAESELTFSLRKDTNDSRALELINKTNQFNLNGRRFTESAWRDYLEQPETFVLTASYRDRFGALGKIAVVTGRRNGSGLSVESWVMSCRAFARRIEHQCLRFLFDSFNGKLIAFDYQPTPRNGPLRSFFTELRDGTPAPGVDVSREQFEAACPKLFHHVRESEDE